MNGPDERVVVDVPDGEIAVRVAGSGPPVMLLHGGMLDHRMWAAQIDALADRYRVLAPDARGHGTSSTPTTPTRACDDVAAVIRELARDPVALVGLSLGARTAVDTTLEHPELVRGLVVSGAGAGPPDFRDPFLLEMFAEWAAAGETRDAERFVRAFLRLATGPARAVADLGPALVAYQRDAAGRNLRAHAGPDAVAPTDVARAADRVGEIRVPVLAIVGALDSADHIEPATTLAAATGGRTARIDGTAHYPNMERPDEFTALVRHFLADLDGTGGRRSRGSDAG